MSGNDATNSQNIPSYKLTDSETRSFMAAGYAAIVGASMDRQTVSEISARQLLRLVTISRLLWDCCVAELERRAMLGTCECCGDPTVPYESDIVIETIFNRDLPDEAEPHTAH